MDTSIHRDQGVHDGKVDLDAYYRTTPSEAVKKEARAIMGGQGVYVKASHAKRWDFVTAGYLDYFLSYAGTQKDRAGWIWKSAREMEEETGITPRQQERCREVLVRSGAIEAEKRGIGNKWNVRPNIPLLRLMDELPTFEEVAATVEQAEPETSRNVNSEPEVYSPQNVEPFPHDVKPLSRFVETHNRNTAVTPINTLSPNEREIHSETGRTRTDSEHEERREEEKNQGKVDRCVEVLSTIEGMSAEPRMLARLVSTLAEKHPRVPLVDACKRYRDKVASMSEPVRSHSAYLAGHFEHEAEKIANEPMNPHGPDAERLRDKPRRADWYATFHGGGVEEYERMIRGGLTHTEIMEAIERRAA
jgi:hypothetical protein